MLFKPDLNILSVMLDIMDQMIYVAVLQTVIWIVDLRVDLYSFYVIARFQSMHGRVKSVL